MDKIDKSVVRSLRSIFVSPKAKGDKISEAIDDAVSELDGKTILIVDEVYSSGRTLQYAREFFKEAFPTSSVATAHWMRGVSKKGEAMGNRDLPVWYKKDTMYGRGIGNRDATLSQKSNNTTQKLGAFFLSRRLPEPDEKSLQLRTELKHLAQSPDVPMVPSIQRPREQWNERLVKLNEGTQEEIIERIREIKGIRH